MRFLSLSFFLLCTGVLLAENVPKIPVPLDPASYGVGQRLPAFRFTDIEGDSYTSADAAKYKAVVFALTNTGCPLCRKHGPTLGALSRTYRDKGIPFVFINPGMFEEEKDMRDDIESYRLVGPYVHDPEETLAKTLRALTTTDVFVMRPDRTLVYRGAVDDRYGLGYARDAARSTYLADALDAILADQAVIQAATWAPGCVLDLELDPPAVLPKATPSDGGGGTGGEGGTTSIGKQDPADLPASASASATASAPGDANLPPVSANLSYHGRIAHILQAHCTECHRKGGVAPFALDSYERTYAKRGMIEEVVADEIMPPWFATPGKHRFANDRSLPPLDKRDLLAWLDGDLAEGDPAEGPTPQTFQTGWHIGKPDAVIEIPREVAIQAEGVMDYVNLTVKTDFGEDKWIRGVELRPSAPEAVHHVLVFARPSRTQARKPRGPLERLRLVLGAQGGFLAGYVPGKRDALYPEGTAKFLPAGASLRFQLHYTPVGRPLKDRTRLGLIFADAPPKKELFNVPIQNTRIRIPAGEDNHRELATREIPLPIEIISFMPHMHVRGKAFRYELIHPDQSVERILDIPHYDFNWQLAYTLETPIRVQRGSVIQATGWFDNSEKNPYNPAPDQTVRWGDQTSDEMLIGYVDFTVGSTR